VSFFIWGLMKILAFISVVRSDLDQDLNYNNNKKKKKKKIYNAHIVMNHESEARTVTMWPDGVC